MIKRAVRRVATGVFAAVALTMSVATAPVPGVAPPDVRPSDASTRVGANTALIADAQSAFDRGEALRRDDPIAAKREFDLAAAGFSTALRTSGGNGLLWFNLGNALLQSGRIGEAIAAYLEAQRLIPSDPRLAANLSVARATVREPISANADRTIWSSVVASRHALAPHTRLWLALAASATFWGLLALKLVRPVPLAAIIASALVSLVLGATVVADLAVARDRSHAVVVAENVAVHESNGEASKLAVAAPLGPGIELVVIDERPDWLKVRLPDGAQGWVRSAHVERIDGQP